MDLELFIKMKHTTKRTKYIRSDGKEYVMRSMWESNYASYLDWLISKKHILDWEYEPDTFWFLKIKRGVRSYKPDFKVFKTKKDVEYHEVKGYMDSRSRTKIKRMAKYYPDVKLIVIDEDSYKSIKSAVGRMLNWD